MKKKNSNGKKKNTEKKLRISQCMITKNEEKNIEKALAWGKSIMDEQIVVDTGSTDRTVEIAKKMGAKVYSFPWIDDFSAAKNYAMDMATGDWIVILDADEYMLEKAAIKVKAYIKLAEDNQTNEKGANGLFCTEVNLKNDGTPGSTMQQIRIFRNEKNLRYTGKIHEYVKYLSDKGRASYIVRSIRKQRECGNEIEIPPAWQEYFWSEDKKEPDISGLSDEKVGVVQYRTIADDDVIIYHTGYQFESVSKHKKAERNVNLLREEVAENPDDFNMQSYLLDSLMMDRKNTQEAVELAKLCMENIKGDWNILRKNETIKRFFQYAALGKIDLTREKLEKIYRDVEEVMPYNGDLDYLAGIWCYTNKLYKEAIKYFSIGIKKLDSGKLKNNNEKISMELDRLFRMLGESCEKINLKEEAVRYYVLSLRGTKYQQYVLYRLIKLFSSDSVSEDSAVQVLEFLKKIYSINISKDRIMIFKAAESAEFETLKKICEQYMTEEDKVKLENNSTIFEDKQDLLDFFVDIQLKNQIDVNFYTMIKNIKELSVEQMIEKAVRNVRTIREKDPEVTALFERQCKEEKLGDLDVENGKYEVIEKHCNFLKENSDKITDVYKIVENYSSKDILRCIVSNLKDFSVTGLSNVWGNRRMLVDPDLIASADQEKAVVDIGSGKGEFLGNMLGIYDDTFESYVCFESDEDKREYIKETYNWVENLKIYEEYTENSFIPDNTGYLKISGDEKIIDILDDRKIKSMIEGGHLEQLSILVESNLKAFTEAVLKIREINSDYRIFLNYYGGNLVPLYIGIIAVK